MAYPLISVYRDKQNPAHFRAQFQEVVNGQDMATYAYRVSPLFIQTMLDLCQELGMARTKYKGLFEEGFYMGFSNAAYAPLTVDTFYNLIHNHDFTEDYSVLPDIEAGFSLW